MNITIFGATGMVGKYLVKHALLKGHTVNAFGRNVHTAGFAENENLHLHAGALFDEGPVLKAINGADVVLSALGGGFDGTDKTRSLGMKNIVKQMEKAGISRIVAIGGMGALDDPGGDIIMNNKNFPPQFLAVSKEHLQAYQYLSASSLQWTFVCPPDISDEDATGIYETAADVMPAVPTLKITAGDLAMFMIKESIENKYPKKRVGITNT